MSFPIDTTIPAAPNDPADDQPLMLQNFQNINSYVSEDHVAPGATNNGKHKFVRLVAQSGVPAGLASGIAAIYTKLVGPMGNQTSQIFYSPDATGQQYQLTRCDPNGTNFARFGTNTTYVANNTGGWTFLPGSTDGLFLQYGFRANPGTSGFITFPRTFTGAPFSVSVSLYRSTGDHSVLIDSGTPPTNSGFNYICDTSGSSGVFWTAIGI